MLKFKMMKIFIIIKNIFIKTINLSINFIIKYQKCLALEPSKN